jgi:hypothetical protein
LQCPAALLLLYRPGPQRHPNLMLLLLLLHQPSSSRLQSADWVSLVRTRPQPHATALLQSPLHLTPRTPAEHPSPHDLLLLPFLLLQHQKH